MRMSVLGLSALVALGSMAPAAVAAATNIVAAASMTHSSVPAAGEVRALDLGGGETVDFEWWPPGQGPRRDASVRRVSPQPGLWTGGVEWRAVGPMAEATKEGAWVAQRPLTAAQRARILWPPAAADVPPVVLLPWLNARVPGGGFSAVPDGNGLLMRQCGAAAGWRLAALETRAVELGEGRAFEMVRMPDGVPGGGDWLATQALAPAERERILWPGAPTRTSVSVVVAWLNAGVPGGGFTTTPSGGDVLVRRCGADAGWQQAALEMRSVELGDRLRLEMQGFSGGLSGGGFWAAREPLSAAQQARILPRGASGAHASLAAVVLWLNRGVAGGGFAVSAGDGGWLVRHGSIGAGWQCVELERTVTLGGDVQLELVWCPPGAFAMGSPLGEAGRQANETPHPATLTKGFWMGKHEVTQAQWKRVMGNDPSHFKGPDLPVESVSWDDCQVFLAKLNALVPGGRFRLPTEAEWEYAGRAGTTSAYAGTLDEMAWYEVNSEGKTHAVGTKRPNEWDLHDMHGNVREWCLDWYAAYPSDAINDPTGPSSGSSHVLRGGSWGDCAFYCRVAYRAYRGSDYASRSFGFRVVLSPGS